MCCVLILNKQLQHRASEFFLARLWRVEAKMSLAGTERKIFFFDWRNGQRHSRQIVITNWHPSESGILLLLGSPARTPRLPKTADPAGLVLYLLAPAAGSKPQRKADWQAALAAGRKKSRRKIS